jgi:hypothetical protein
VGSSRYLVTREAETFCSPMEVDVDEGKVGGVSESRVLDVLFEAEGSWVAETLGSFVRGNDLLALTVRRMEEV